MLKLRFEGLSVKKTKFHGIKTDEIGPAVNLWKGLECGLTARKDRGSLTKEPG